MSIKRPKGLFFSCKELLISSERPFDEEKKCGLKHWKTSLNFANSKHFCRFFHDFSFTLSILFDILEKEKGN